MHSSNSIAVLLFSFALGAYAADLFNPSDPLTNPLNTADQLNVLPQPNAINPLDALRQSNAINLLNTLGQSDATSPLNTLGQPNAINQLNTLGQSDASNQLNIPSQPNAGGPLGAIDNIGVSDAAGSIGSPEGFAQGTTGGAGGPTVVPTSREQLVAYLTDDAPRIVVLKTTFDFRGTEGQATKVGCQLNFVRTCSKDYAQDAIDSWDWCKGSQPIQVTFDVAATNPINVGSYKTIRGDGRSGVILGKGLRIAGKTNVIIQNIWITELNAPHVWGGDAITLEGAKLVWVDHCKISHVGRQMFVAHIQPTIGLTISYTEFDGYSQWSATCDQHHYWGILFREAQHQCTFKGNFLHHLSGRGPKLDSRIQFHAVNNEWYAISGHAFDIAAGDAWVLAEGNYLDSVYEPVKAPLKGRIFTAPDNTGAICQNYFKRSCAPNFVTNSGPFRSDDAGFLGVFNNLPMASARGPGKTEGMAGIGKIR